MESERISQVRFRRVGQGDSIIIESWNNDIGEIGIIDCKNDEIGVNAIISYLKYLILLKKKFRIKFFLLTHPHRDHCCGTIALFEYLRKHGIELKQFGSTFYHNDKFHTLPETMPRIILRIKQSFKLLKKKFDENGISIHTMSIDYGSSPHFNNHVSTFCLAPDAEKIDIYLEKMRTGISEGRPADSGIENMLSTIFRIQCGNKFILLTSDADMEEFEKLIKDQMEFFDGLFLRAGQIPHHGSDNNYHAVFWDKMPWENSAKLAVISVGKNGHQHPSDKVIADLEFKNYDVRRTDRPEMTTEEILRCRRALHEVGKKVDPGNNDIVVTF